MMVSLQAQQPLGHPEIIDGLRDAEQRRYHDHSARATLEERPRAFVLERLPARRETAASVPIVVRVIWQSTRN